MHGARTPLSNDSTHVAACNAASVVALAALSFALPALAADATTIELQVTPAGKFLPCDGREMVVEAWQIDATSARAVIDRFGQRKTQLVIDYEHQTLKKDDNGQPAPAAAWFQSLTWREGRGLFATVELTARARDYIRANEYRYFSPVFSYDGSSGSGSGTVLEILMGALTNTPAIEGMQPLAALAAARFGLNQETPVDKTLLAAIVAALALGANTTEAQAIAACSAKLDELRDLRKALGLADTIASADAVAACAAAKAKADEATGLRKALGLADTVASGDAIAACTAVKTKADTATGVDPAKYVPVAVVEELKRDVAALSAKTRDGEVIALVDTALADGRLLKAQKDWAIELGKKDVASLSAYLASAQPIAALTSTQTRGMPPVAMGDAHGLTPDQLAICTSCGIEPEKFAKSLAAEKSVA